MLNKKAMDSKKAELFKVLGVESRIRIIQLLKREGSLGVNELSKVLGITPSAVCQHLKLLKHAGLVRNERKGYWVPYKINTAALEECGEIISEVCTCSCRETGRPTTPEIDRDQDKLAFLKKYERELLNELEAVRQQIGELHENQG